jgi:hypothetical protein
MIRSLIAFIAAFAIAFTGIMEPAYAYSNNSGTVLDNHKEHYSNQYNYGDSYYGNGSEDPLGEHVDNVVNGAVKTVEFAAGAAIACYTLDGIATVFFPPAATLSAFCPALAGMTGGAKVATQMAH